MPVVGFSRSVAALSVTLQENQSANPSWTNVTGTGDIDFVGTSPGPDAMVYSLRAVASGGIPPYTYAWARVSGSSEFSADSATSDQTTFTVDSAGNGYGAAESAMWKCTVTDSRSVAADPAQNANLLADGSL